MLRLIRVTHPTKMRRYHMVFEMLVILSIIDFTLAAPVLVQEKRQLYVDVVQIPKDVRTLLRKRVGEDDLAKLAEEYLETGGKPIESSDTHARRAQRCKGPTMGQRRTWCRRHRRTWHRQHPIRIR